VRFKQLLSIIGFVEDKTRFELKLRNTISLQKNVVPELGVTFKKLILQNFEAFPLKEKFNCEAVEGLCG
jgi:hypothetical protein